MKFNVPDMSCGHCKASVEKAVLALDSAAQIDVDLSAKIVSVESTASAQAVVSALDAVGFPATPLPG